jgi:hypothetical protein
MPFDVIRRLKMGRHSLLAWIRLHRKIFALRRESRKRPAQAAAYWKSRAQNPPIFVVGCGHSGTSLLLALLDAHSRLCAIPEESKIAYDYDKNQAIARRNLPAMVRYFDLFTLTSGKFRWIEKTPKHIYSIPLLREIFPGAKFILIIRDGRDVACSIEARYGSLQDGIERWIEDNRFGEKFRADPDVHIVKYEDLVTDPNRALDGIFAFLGETFEEEVLRSHEKPKFFYSDKIEKPSDATARNHEQYRNWQINQKLFDGRGRWKDLAPEKKKLIKDAAGPMLIEYGYAQDLDW